MSLLDGETYSGKLEMCHKAHEGTNNENFCWTCTGFLEKLVASQVNDKTYNIVLKLKFCAPI